MRSMFRVFLIALILFSGFGCSLTKLPKIGPNISYGVLNNDDLETVGAGLPTYLLILDGLLETYPENVMLLTAASSLNSAYAGLYVKDKARAKKMSEKALSLSLKAICAHNKKACGLRKMEFADFENVIKKMDNKKKDVPVLYSLGTAWASYIQSNSGDWNAVAELAKAAYIIEHIAKIDITYENGMVPLYLGVLNSILPPAIGGKPDVAKKYFDQAIDISNGKNLIIKVMYAQQYAKLLFDRELHDKLLNEVMAEDPHVYGLTLQNVYAQKEAKRLLEEADDYF